MTGSLLAWIQKLAVQHFTLEVKDLFTKATTFTPVFLLLLAMYSKLLSINEFVLLALLRTCITISILLFDALNYDIISSQPHVYARIVLYILGGNRKFSILQL